MQRMTMKALVKTRKERGLELLEVPLPDVQPGTVLVKIAAAGICGSDRHIYEWDEGRNALSNNVPFTLGHEGAGIIERVGHGVHDVAEGDRVAFESHIHDDCSYVQANLENICPHKRILGIGTDGVFAEYVLVPAHIIRKLPVTVTLEVGAILEPATIGLRALDMCARQCVKLSVPSVPRVAIFGATGIMGATASLAAYAYGFEAYAFGRNEAKLSLLKEIQPELRVVMPNDETLDPWAIRDSFDAVIETTGADSSLSLGRQLIRAAGCWVQIGLFGNESGEYRAFLNDTVRREIAVRGVVGRTTREWDKVMDCLSRGLLKLDRLITDRYDLGDYERAFQTKEGIKSVFTIS